MAQSSFHRHSSLEDITNEYLYLCHFGWEKCQHGYSYGPAIRGFYLIHYIFAGRGYYEARGQRYELHPGQSFIIYPGETTRYQADEQDPWTYYYFSLSGSLAPLLLDMTNFREGNMVIDIDGAPLMKILQKAMVDIDEYPNKLLYGISVLTSLINVYAQEVAQVDPSVSKTVSLVSRAKDYIDFNYSDKMTVEKVASMLAVSRNHLYRMFKSEVGISPMEYLTSRRIRFAAKLLEETDRSAAEISNVVGFDTYSAFYRAFKLAFGMSANQYRAQIRSQAMPLPLLKGELSDR